MKNNLIQNPTLSVVIPCFNECSTIEQILKNVKNVKTINKEVIVIDDASNDGTLEKLKSLDKYYDKLIIRNKNGGKGASVKDGVEAASGELIISQDADLEYDPQDYIKLIKPIIDGYADVVYGTRFSNGVVSEGENRSVNYFWNRVANSLLTTASNMLSNLYLTDMATCYKVFRSDIIKDLQLKENRFGLDPEITAKIAKKHVRMYEVAISYKARTYQQGKKIKLKDAFRATYCIFKYNILN